MISFKVNGISTLRCRQKAIVVKLFTLSFTLMEISYEAIHSMFRLHVLQKWRIVNGTEVRTKIWLSELYN